MPSAVAKAICAPGLLMSNAFPFQQAGIVIAAASPLGHDVKFLGKPTALTSGAPLPPWQNQPSSVPYCS